ncbi:unnamed protein product [Schistosoma guineensis]|nr:unnamed protein product [Schistosoma guineensis]
MSFRSIVPPPDFLSKAEFNRPCGRSPNKISTLLTNVQRRNVQTLAPTESKDLTFFQMAAQGELLLLQREIESRNFNIDVPDNQFKLKGTVFWPPQFSEIIKEILTELLSGLFYIRFDIMAYVPRAYIYTLSTICSIVANVDLDTLCDQQTKQKIFPMSRFTRVLSSISFYYSYAYTCTYLLFFPASVLKKFGTVSLDFGILRLFHMPRI